MKKLLVLIAMLLVCSVIFAQQAPNKKRLQATVLLDQNGAQGVRVICKVESIDPVVEFSDCAYRDDGEPALRDVDPQRGLLALPLTHKWAKAIEHRVTPKLSTVHILETARQLCLESIDTLGGLTQDSDERMNLCVPRPPWLKRKAMVRG